MLGWARRCFTGPGDALLGQEMLCFAGLGDALLCWTERCSVARAEGHALLT